MASGPPACVIEFKEVSKRYKQYKRYKSQARRDSAPRRRQDARQRLRQRGRIIAAEVQAAAFAPLQGAVDDQRGHVDQVAQFQQVVGDAEVLVILVDFFLQQRDAVLRAFQPFRRAHDADVVPHEAAQLVPVVRDDDFLVGVGDAAFVPVRQIGDFILLLRGDVLRAGAADHQAFKQRVAGQAVGAVQAGAGGFADGVQARDVGASGQVGDHAAAGVVRGRHDRNRLLGDVDAQFQAARVDGGEVLDQECGRLVADVEVDVVEAALLDLEVDGAGHHVARRQLGALVVFQHEAAASGGPGFRRQFQQAAFAAYRFRDQEGFGVGMV